MQSAIGEGMTRRDHSDVSNQVVYLDSIHLVSFKLWHILTVELIYAVSCNSFMRTMQLERMSRPWKPLWERRRSLLRIWFVTNNYWNNPMLMSLLEVNLIFCSLSAALFGIPWQIWEEICYTRSIWYKKHLSVTWPGMDIASHIPSWASPSYPCEDIGSVLQQRCYALIYVQ